MKVTPLTRIAAGWIAALPVVILNEALKRSVIRMGPLGESVSTLFVSLFLLGVLGALAIRPGTGARSVLVWFLGGVALLALAHLGSRWLSHWDLDLASFAGDVLALVGMFLATVGLGRWILDRVARPEEERGVGL